MAERLGRAGVKLVSEPGPVLTPGGGYGFRFFDNDGRTVEVSCDVAVRQHRQIDEGETVPVKLSHVVIHSPHPHQTVAFYQRVPGFALSDTLTHPRLGSRTWFMRTHRFHTTPPPAP